MKRLVAVGFASLLVFPGISLAQQDTLACSKIADSSERLACFDRAFPTDSSKPASIPSSAPEDSTPVIQEALATAPSSSSSTNSSMLQEPDSPSRGMFSWREKLNISSRLISVRDKDKQKMVFQLENDQIWLQDSPRSLPFAEGDEITIKSATIGGYIMSNSKGVSTRVRQIK